MAAERFDGGDAQRLRMLWREKRLEDRPAGFGAPQREKAQSVHSVIDRGALLPRRLRRFPQ